MGLADTRSSLVEALDIQELGARTVIYGEINDLDMRYFNPSIAWHEGKLKIAIRSCNFKVERRGKWSFRDGSAYSKTDVLYGDLDPKSLEVSSVEKLRLSTNSPTRLLVAGLEDVRIFSRKEGMYAIGFESDRITRSLHNESASMALYLIKGSQLMYMLTLPKPDKKVVEKNWSPSDVPSKLFDFTYSDTQVYKKGELIGEPTVTQIHGGSQLLLQEDGSYLSLVHEKKLDPKFTYNRNSSIYDKYIYFHYLARHGKDGIITQLSKPFRFGTLENIEFAGGMVQDGNDLIISYGIRDCKYAICKVKKDKLVDLLEDIKED